MRGINLPVVAGDDLNLTVLHDGRAVQIPRKGTRFKMEREPMLSRRQLAMEVIRAEPVHDPRSDPARETLQRQMMMSSIDEHRQDIASIEQANASANAEKVAALAESPGSGVTQDDVRQADSAAAAATAKLSEAFSMPMSPNFIPTYTGPRDEAGFDAFEVSFRLSSAEPLRDVMGLMRLEVRDSFSATPISVLKFFALRSVDPKPRKITVLQSGLPSGFSVAGYTIHLYVDGQELPTNLSENRLEVSGEEAHQFLVLRHSYTNAQATIPAQLIPELVPDRTRAGLRTADPALTVEFQIDKNGKATAASTSVVAGDSALGHLNDLLRDVCFLPALQNGRPVASRGTFAISEIID